MNAGLYQGASALSALQRMQAIVSENIANASVPGYQKTDASFDSVLGNSTQLEGGKFSKALTAAMPQMVSRVSRQPGELRATNNELDFAVSGRGFFSVQKPDGTTAYTRDGEFHLSPDRTLVNKQGLPVLSDGGPITFRPEGGRVSITPEGQVIQGDLPVGKLNIVDFADDQPLKRLGDGLLASASGAAPQPIEKPTVVNGTLETSNVSSLQEMVNLITVSRAYESSQKVVMSQDEVEDKAIQILGNPS